VIAAVQGQQKNLQTLKGVVVAQSHEIEKLKLKLAYVARLAGVSDEMDAIEKRANQIKRADVANPGQPVPDPASQGPTESTEQAVTPETYDDPRRPGQTPGSVQDLPADATDLALNPGETLPTSPYGDMVDVTAPVAGTETHVPNEQTRIETDVRVGDPMSMDTAFPWVTSPNQSNGQPPASGEMGQGKAASVSSEDLARVRTFASITLARLRIQAGIAQGDDLSVAGSIEQSELTDGAIDHEIKTLSKVQKAAAQRPRPAGLVPRSASAQRTTPSLAGGATPFAQPAVSQLVEDSFL
jgi:hypothetical protein